MKIPKVLRFFPPILIFFMTIFLVYLCFSHSLLKLAFEEKYVTVFLLWMVLSVELILWFWGFISLMLGDPGEIKNELKMCPNMATDCVCKKCGYMKPYRTHHCSQCGVCYAKMDHHCVVLGKCVAIRNQKPFIVFLGHSIILAIFWFIATLITVISVKFEEFPRVLIVDFFGSSSLATLVFILFYDQIDTILSGKTTIEIEFKYQFRGKQTKYENWRQVFGDFSMDWILPTPTPYSRCNAFMWEPIRHE